jgi:dihydrofolate reductase
MRKIVAGLFMSLDGVVESPEQWAYQYATSQMWDDMAAGITQADAILLGQRTYRQFARLWPDQHSETPMAAFLNTTHKYVVSATLDTLDWGPASLITSDVAAALTELKRRPGKNIQIPGSPTLVRSLLAAGLLDEVSLTICPVVMGLGMRLFQDMTDRVPLTLAQSKTFSTGAFGVTYRPENA